MLFWNTVTPLLKQSFLTLMDSEVFSEFRLVGGTALSLHLGHRMSVDIDLFTDLEYGSVDFNKIDQFLTANFSYVDFGTNVLPGMGKSYFIGNSKEELVKLDIYYSTEKFIRNSQEIENVRLATLDDIVAMKIDVVSRGGRKKDFWDLHELFRFYNLQKMLDLHKERHEWTHSEEDLRLRLLDFEDADGDFEPNCLRGKHWELIKEDFIEMLR